MNKFAKHIAYSLVMLLATGHENVHAQEIYKEGGAPAAVQLRTNLVHDLALCPNIGIEIQTDLGLAWQLDYSGAWWNKRSNNKYYSCYAFETELRYYFKSRREAMPYRHHHIGVYGQMLTYDFEFKKTGCQSARLDKTFGVGASYGYLLPISKNWAFDFTLGVGYFQSLYDKYIPTVNGYHRTGTHKLKFGGPTKLEVTAVWYINTKNSKYKNHEDEE